MTRKGKSKNIKKCPAGPSYHPSRLLHIELQGSSKKVSLKSKQLATCKAAQYVALSYCWGGDQPFKTTGANLVERHGFIDYHLLPATIRDACEVTLKLGYSYLWVDSLCIVQDNQHELAVEIAKMPQIYSNATVIIAASRASSSIEGFLHQRDTSHILPVTMHAKGRDEAVGEVRLVQIFGDRYEGDI